MLSSLRGALKGWVAWLVIALLVLAFAFFGIPDLRNIAQSSPLQVGKVKYSAEDVTEEFDRQLGNLRQRAGDQITREEALRFGLVNQTIEALTFRAALQQDSGELGLTATTQMVADYLQSNPGYQNPNTGKFDQQVLTQILQYYRIGLLDFRNEISEELVRDQLIESVSVPTDASTPFVTQFALRQTEQRDLDFVVVTEEEAEAVAEPTDEQLRAYFNENTATYTAPEYRTFRVVSLVAENFREGLEIDEAELKAIYELRKDQFNKPETRSFRQLILSSLTEADEAIAALQAGGSFEELVENKGLTLDAATSVDKALPQIPDAELGKAIFALSAEGDVTAPIRSLFGGYTIAQLINVTEGEETTFEDQRETLEAASLEEETTRRMLDTIELIENARDEGATVGEAIAEIPEIKVTSYGPVDNALMTPQGAIINDLSAEILAEAFALQAGDESELEDLATGNGYFLVIVDDVEDPRLKDFEAVQADISKAWAAEQRRQNIRRAATAIEEKVAEGTSLSDAVSGTGLEVSSITTGRYDTTSGLTVEALQQVFLADLESLVSETDPTNDHIYLIDVKSASFPPSVQGGLLVNLYRDSLKDQLAGELREAYFAALQQDLGVKRNAERLSQLFGEDQ